MQYIPDNYDQFVHMEIEEVRWESLYRREDVEHEIEDDLNGEDD